MEKRLVSLSVFLFLAVSLIPGYSPAAVNDGAVNQDGALLYEDIIGTDKCSKGELLVKFKSSASAEAKQKVHDKHGSKVVKDFPSLRIQHIKLKADISFIEAIGRYQSDPKVEYVDPNYKVVNEDFPNDPRFNELWGLFNTGQTGGTAGAGINTPIARRFTRG